MTILAPEIAATHWFNTPKPLSLADLRGRVVVLHAFQMLCPGCVAHALPQTERLHRLFRHRDDVAVIGLHTVFEHHAAMTPISLEAFIHEYRLTFPIGVDEPGDGDLPRTMLRYGMRGTPTTVVIDPAGGIVEQAFGQIDDLALGILVGSLIARRRTAANSEDVEPETGCNDGMCPAPSGRAA